MKKIPEKHHGNKKKKRVEKNLHHKKAFERLIEKASKYNPKEQKT